ncbi:MAG: hypothetical protein HYX74_03170 [Acidobacteria bacterium]|nr:hypothetical protein [Acidobacteriota bacterium]
MRSLLKYLDYQFLLPLVARFPYPVAYRLAEWRGDALYLSRKQSRRHAIENILKAFPSLAEGEAREIARSHYRTLSVDEMESFWFDRTSEFFDRYVSVDGLENLRRAAHPGGALLLLGHWGSACTLFVALGRRGVSFHIVGRPLERATDCLHPAHLRYGKKRVADIEKAVGHPFLYTGRGNFERMQDLLHAGQIIMIMFDVTPNILRHVRPVRFFDRTAYFADGVVRLQRQTGARLFRGSIRRQRHPPYQRIQIREVDVASSTGDDELLQQLVGMLEEEIREDPSRWTLWDSLGWFYQPPETNSGSAAQ